MSEAAENLCRQAAVSVRKDKEDEARELLLQKKKVMLALEKSKGRVELLDELAAKLTEVKIIESCMYKYFSHIVQIKVLTVLLFLCCMYIYFLASLVLLSCLVACGLVIKDCLVKQIISYFLWVLLVATDSDIYR